MPLRLVKDDRIAHPIAPRGVVFSSSLFTYHVVSTCLSSRSAIASRGGELLAQLAHLPPDSLVERLVVGTSEHLADPPGDGAHLRLAHAARGQSGGTNADPARVHRLPGVKGNHVLVDGNAGGIEGLLGNLARQS